MSNTEPTWKKIGFKSESEYLKHLSMCDQAKISKHEAAKYCEGFAKDKGFKSIAEYQEYLAKDNGFMSYAEYKEYLSIFDHGKNLKHETVTHCEGLAKYKGFKSLAEYHEYLAKKK
jgi:hypothetical protein